LYKDAAAKEKSIFRIKKFFCVFFSIVIADAICTSNPNVIAGLTRNPLTIVIAGLTRNPLIAEGMLKQVQDEGS